MRRRASPVTEKSRSVFATEISVTRLENFPHTGTKLERSCLVKLGNRADICNFSETAEVFVELFKGAYSSLTALQADEYQKAV